jgi:transposase
LLGVEGWAELRREHFVRGVSIKELARRSGLSRNTIRAGLRAAEPPKYERAPAGSKLDPFKDEIHRLLGQDASTPGQRIRELIEPLGFDGGKTIVDDYLREIRPLFQRPRTFQRTVYRPGEICGSRGRRSRSGMARRAGLGCDRVPGLLGRGRGRGRARALQADAGSFGRHPPLSVVAGSAAEHVGLGRQSGLHAGGGRPTRELAAFCGHLRVDWWFCEPRDPQAKGVVERLQDFAERSFEPGRVFANELDFQVQLDDWFDGRANARTHKTLRCRPVDRLAAEREAMAPLPATPPDTDRCWVLRVPADPHLRFDTNDYSLDPRLAGRRVEVRVSEREISAIALDTGELACRHQRSFAKHRTVTALEHARTLKELRGAPTEPVVEQRPLAAYDALIA